MSFGVRVRLLLLLLLFLVSFGLVLFQPLVPAFAQGADLQNEDCMLTPHSEDCICATVRKFGDFPKKFDPENLYYVDDDGNRHLRGKDVDLDGKFPILGEDGVWVDGDGEADNANDE